MLGELWWLLEREVGATTADRVVAGLLDHGLRREPLVSDDDQRAFELGRAWPDQDFSLTDRLAFAAIERSRHLRAWSFDHHVAVVRLGARRDRAIELPG